MTLMPLNHILRNCIEGEKFTKSQAKMNYIMHMDDVKVFVKKIKKNRRP